MSINMIWEQQLRDLNRKINETLVMETRKLRQLYMMKDAIENLLTWGMK